MEQLIKLKEQFKRDCEEAGVPTGDDEGYIEEGAQTQWNFPPRMYGLNEEFVTPAVYEAKVASYQRQHRGPAPPPPPPQPPKAAAPPAAASAAAKGTEKTWMRPPGFDGMQPEGASAACAADCPWERGEIEHSRQGAGGCLTYTATIVATLEFPELPKSNIPTIYKSKSRLGGLRPSIIQQSNSPRNPTSNSYF